MGFDISARGLAVEANQRIEDIINSGLPSDGKIKVSITDTTSGYLMSKLLGTTNKITITKENPSGNEDLKLNIGSDIFDKSINTSDNINQGTINLFMTTAERNKLAGLVNGINIHGNINTSNDFPLSADVVAGDAYVISTVPVTDNVPLHTNTGITFNTLNEIIVWGVSGGWIRLGSGSVFSVNGKNGTVVLTTADISDSLNKRYITDSEKTILGNTSGTNTGDETQSTIKTKLGNASTTNDGYLTSTDWNTFNNKQSSLGFTPENVSNKENTTLDSSTSKYPTNNLVKSYVDGKSGNVGSKSVDESQIGDLKILQYNQSTNKLEYVDAPSGGGMLNVRSLGMVVSNNGNNAIISFVNPVSDSIDRIYLFASYLEDLTNQNYSYCNTNATLLSNTFITTTGVNNTYNLTINEINRNKYIYIKVFVGYGGTDYSSGSSLSQVLSDITPTSPVTNISITQLSQNSVQLNWTNPSETDLKNVNVVMKYNSSLNNIYDGTIVYTGNNNTCILTGLTLGSHIYFRLYTLDTSDNIQSNSSQAIDIQLDNTPPNDATSFSILSGYSVCKLKFTESNSSDWKSSKVIRKIGSEPSSIEDGTLILTNFTKDAYKNNYYVDGGLNNGTTYYYKIYSIDNFGNISSGTVQSGTPVATALPEVSNFLIENIENGTKQKISWTNPFAPSGLTYIERQLFYTKDQTVTMDSMTRDQCVASSFITSLNLGSGTGQGLADNYTTGILLSKGEVIRYKIFVKYDSSGTAIWNAGTYDIKEVKDETPCVNYTNISAIGFDSEVRLTYTDPIDSDWNKTVILVTRNAYATDENYSGSDLIQKTTSTIKNQYSSTALSFTGLTNGIPVYISLFSYDTSGNINRNVVNRVTVTPNQIVVNNPTSLTGTSNTKGTSITLNWTNATGNYTSREIYGSTVDISGFTRQQCIDGGYTLDTSNGTGAGNSDTYIHNGLSHNTVYYYKIFTKYIYNSMPFYSTGTSVNTTCLDTQAPLNLTTFTANAKNNEIDLTWAFNASDTDIQKIVLVRTINTYATSIDDTSNNATKFTVNYPILTYNDLTVTNGTQYYYRAFIYDIHNNLNSSIIGQQLTIAPQANQEYGIRWNKSSDTITRLGNAVGKTAITGGQNDFSSLLPWSGIKRCNLSDTGEVNAYYGDANYKVDGTNGQVMVEIPKFWFKVVNVDANNIEFWICDSAKSGYEVHPAFFRDRLNLCDNNSGTAIEVSKRYIGAYEGCQQNGSSYVGGAGYNSATVTYNASYKLASVSGYSPTNNINISQARTLAKNRGVGWSQQDYYLTYAIQLLYLVEYAHFDSQTKIGNGNSNSTAILNTGQTNTNGNASFGTTANKTSAMSYRGIENFYGNVYQWIDGFYCNASNNIQLCKKGFNDTCSNYDYTYTTGVSSISGYISDIFGDKYAGFTVKTASGSATTKLYDYGYLYASYLPVFGGYCGSDASCGCFFLRVAYAASDSGWFIGARLAF